jgi:ribonuclease Z
MQILEEFRSKAQKLAAREPRTEDEIDQRSQKYPKVVFLGTVSGYSLKYRNETGILVTVSETKSLLLDCGNYTIGQMHKFYGLNGLDAELVKLKGICVSHCHPDHCQGLFGVIEARQQAFKNLKIPYEKLYIICPNTVSQIKVFWVDFFEADFRQNVVQVVPMDFFSVNSRYKKNSNNTTILDQLGLASLKSVPVDHIEESYGMCLGLIVKKDQSDEKPPSIFNLVYSGDCRPSNDLIKAGKDCDLLIHECTFDNSSYERAVEVKHSTIGEALEVSKEMNAKHTLLTHISARYSKFVITEDMNIDKCTFAFDFMSVSPDQMSLLNKKTVAKVNVLFKEAIIEYDKIIAKKNSIRSS